MRQSKQDRNIQAMLLNLREDIVEIVDETNEVPKDAIVAELMAKVDEIVLSVKTGKLPK